MIQYINIIKKYTPSIFYIFFKKIYHILRFYSLIKPNYNTPGFIKFGGEETGNFLKDKILKSNFFLEFGSGNTTIFAFKNKINFYSIESDRNFYFHLKNENIKNIYFYSLGFVEHYSYPLFKSAIFQKFYKTRAKAYASKVFQELKKNSLFPDLILVDGRYRVLCMLHIFNFLKINNLINTCVILDDFKERQYYQVLKNFFKITTKGRLGICFLDESVSNKKFETLIDFYSNDPR